MKRTLILAVSTALFLLVPATVASAEGYGPPNTGPQVAPQLIEAPSGLAFTGSQVVALIALAAVALILGVGMYAFGRRHARAAA